MACIPIILTGRSIYTKLSPGKYVFRLKSQMQGGNWDIEPVEHTIIIIPASVGKLIGLNFCVYWLRRV